MAPLRYRPDINQGDLLLWQRVAMTSGPRRLHTSLAPCAPLLSTAPPVAQLPLRPVPYALIDIDAYARRPTPGCVTRYSDEREFTMVSVPPVKRVQIPEFRDSVPPRIVLLEWLPSGIDPDINQGDHPPVAACRDDLLGPRELLQSIQRDLDSVSGFNFEDPEWCSKLSGNGIEFKIRSLVAILSILDLVRKDALVHQRDDLPQATTHDLFKVKGHRHGRVWLDLRAESARPEGVTGEMQPVALVIGTNKANCANPTTIAHSTLRWS